MRIINFLSRQMATDPENTLAYEGKAYFRKEAGDEAQVTVYDKIARKKNRCRCS